MTHKPSVYIVIAAHNEAQHLPVVLKKISHQTKQIVVVDDGSTDNTAAIARRYTKHCLQQQNLGKGAAMRAGADFAFQKLRATYVIFIDGDGQHDPTDLKHFFALLNQAKAPRLIFGLRNLKQGMSLNRVLANRFISLIIWLLFDFYISDSLSGYKALSRAIYPKLRWDSNNYSVEVEISCRTARNYLPFATVPIKTIYHDTVQKMRLSDGLKIIGKILHLRLTL